jgi:hypothetical protein
MHISDVRIEPDPSTNPGSDSDAHRRRNFDICKGINMTSLGIVLDDMVEAGMPKELAEIYKLQAGSLLALLRTENNRIFSQNFKKK